MAGLGLCGELHVLKIVNFDCWSLLELITTDRVKGRPNRAATRPFIAGGWLQIRSYR